MKVVQRIGRYMNPLIEPEVLRDVNRQSLRAIHYASSVILAIEVVLLLSFLSTNIGKADGSISTSTISISCCIALCSAASFLSSAMLKRQSPPTFAFYAFKVVFFTAFAVWSILVDYRHYMVGDQMLTFQVVNLIMVSFVLFRPWIGTLLIGCAYTGLFVLLYNHDAAAGIQPLNYLVLMLASVITNALRFHIQISISSKTLRLADDNKELQNASHHDGLTGLLNRLALGEHASKANGRIMTVYMIDINYFKDINDQYGHVAGDSILKQTSAILKRLYPDGHYYRYGGDEFLVITHKPAVTNYGADTFDYVPQGYDIKVLLSIGSAQGSPNNYQAFYDLITCADKALYTVKTRTHSPEFGGHCISFYN